jgi:hypothetical protein
MDRDKYNFILIEHKHGTNPKTGEATHSETKKYFPSLELVCTKLIEDSIKVKSMQTILSSIQQAKEDVISFIKDARKQK